MKFTVLSLMLTGFLAIACLSYTNARAINNSAPATTSHLTTIATEQQGKSKICHFGNDQDLDQDSPGIFSVVINVNDHSLLAHLAHGDCFTEAPKGSVNCTCGPAPEITSFGIIACCLPLYSWTSTGGTSAELQHLNNVGGIIESIAVEPNGSYEGFIEGLFTGPVLPFDRLRLVITGPGGTVFRTIPFAGLGCCSPV